MATPSDDEEGLGPLERGRGRYQKGEYKGALAAFTEAVNISSGHLLLKALDSRAGTYEKLGDLNSALRDAKKMIETMPGLSKGYLRCGKVLRLLKQHKIAASIYERGLRKVKIGADNDRTKLHSMYLELCQIYNVGKSRDPLEKLPIEIAQMVCEYLSMRDRVICLAVTKPWKRLLESSHNLWTTLDTTNVKNPISDKSLKLHLKRSNYELDRALLTLKAVKAQQIPWVIKHCKKLKELRILGSGMIGDSLTSALAEAKKLKVLATGRNMEISLATVQACMAICKGTLVDVHFLKVKGSPGGFLADKWAPMQSLQAIRLEADGNSCLDFLGLRDATPNAISVVLNSWKIMPNFVECTWSNIQHLDLSNTQLSRFPKFPPTLRFLNLSRNYSLNRDGDQDIIFDLPLLESLDIESTSLMSRDVKALTKRSIENGTLKILLLGGRYVSNRSPVEDEFPPCPTLEELSIGTLPLEDTRALQILKLYSKLRKVDLAGTMITGVTVRSLVEKGVTSINLDECANVGQDAIEWARGKGVEVQFNMHRKPPLSPSVFWNSSFARSFAT